MNKLLQLSGIKTFKSLIKTIDTPLMVMSAIDDFFHSKMEILQHDLEAVEIVSLGESGIASTELHSRETVDIISSFMKKVEASRA